MSALFKATIKTSEQHEHAVIVTAQQTTNTIDGNPRFKVQVWIDREATAGVGNLWTPKIKGYRRTKDDAYIVESYHIKEDINHFLRAFQDSVIYKE